MARILDARTQLDSTVRIFDDFYTFDLVVNGNEYDIVHGYFVLVCDTKQIAANFTAHLFRISQQTQVPVLDLLNYIKGLNNKLEMNTVITYYLNSFKSKTSLYGIGKVPQPNQPVARNIVL
jgi:hypothetical protein